MNRNDRPPTERQFSALEAAGIAKHPATRREAQALLAKHHRPKSQRGKSGRLANKKRKQEERQSRADQNWKGRK